jgi:4-alpha-glucanotransferase
MKLTFRLRFYTHYGQSLFLTGNHDLLGNGDFERAVALKYLNETFWEVSLAITEEGVPDANIIYNYVLRNADGSLLYDWGKDRVLNPAAFRADEVLMIDAWNSPGLYENVFYTEPFKNVLLQGRQREFQSAAQSKVTHTFKAKAPLLSKNQTLCLLGNNPALGGWNADAPILLSRIPGEDFSTAELDLSQEMFPVLYKYGVYDLEEQIFVRYEDGENRTLQDAVAPNKQTIVHDGFAVLPANTWKGAGVAIPVFSLRTEKSFGIGEFTDLKFLADWASHVGLKLIQILPVNDTTASHTRADSYPYSAISAFALNPIYLNLRQAANGENRLLLRELEGERQRLNALEALDYEAVASAKLSFLKRIYPSQRDETFASDDYQQFFEQNKHWLEPYAAFCYLRDKYGTSDYEQWPAAYRRYNAEQIVALAGEGEGIQATELRGSSVGRGLQTTGEDYPVSSSGAKGRVVEGATALLDRPPELAASDPDKPAQGHPDLPFHYFIQYHLHVQLQEAAEYARAKGVILKGDVPIGVSRCCADTWENPQLYYLDRQAGAPPDAFAVKGQNWGFPIYNWQRMKEDGFAWWKRRFEQMSCYFDAFRIDHILGFFRIWSIPQQAVEGIMGYFVPAIPVHVDEFRQRGIWFDHDRYTKPFITDRVLREVFADDDKAVKARFLASERFGNYSLKPQFATQRQVERYFADRAANERNHRVKEGLYDLISNVILFEVPDSQGQQFHFRFAMENTGSFKDLDGQTQGRLRDLYIDYFFRRQDEFWRKQGIEKLPPLKRATDMLVCGEDLGLVPPCVPEVMRQFGLLSLEVQRMPKALNREFSRPSEAPYLSVVTPSTHDMSTIRGWWKEDRARMQRFFNEELGQPGEAPECCEPWINEAIVGQHLASPAIWSIFQLQDLLGMDERWRRKNPDEERINVPADANHYWRYRMHLTLETLLQAHEFNDKVRTLNRENGR